MDDNNIPLGYRRTAWGPYYRVAVAALSLHHNSASIHFLHNHKMDLDRASKLDYLVKFGIDRDTDFLNLNWSIWVYSQVLFVVADVWLGSSSLSAR